MFSRRDLGRMALLPVSTMLAKKIDSAFHGVQFGLQSYIFSGIGLPHGGILDLVIKSMVECGLGECDLFAPLVEPADLWERIRAGAPARPGEQVTAQAAAARAQAREELAKWRMTVSLDHFRAIRTKFDAAGIAIHGLSAFPGSTMDELTRTFNIAELLGARIVTLGVTLSAAMRVAPLAEKRDFIVGIQGQPDLSINDPDVISNLHPISELSAENCTEQMGVPGPWYERLPHFRMGFTPSAGKELQSEYFVPRANAVDAILAMERLRDQVTPHLLISEIRTIAADDLWMSTCYRRPSITIHFTWKPDWPAVRRLLPVIEKELSPFQPRPHWGKLFTVSPAEIRSRYERLSEFTELATKYDPKGKFRNDFLNTNVFAG